MTIIKKSKIIKSFVLIFIIILGGKLGAASFSLDRLSLSGGAIYPFNSWYPGYQIGAGLSVFQLSEDISISTGVCYWESQNSKEIMEGVALSDVRIGLGFKYDLPASGYYSGFGLSYNSIYKDYHNSRMPQPLQQEPENLFGASLFTGYNISYDGYDALFAELEYSHISNYNTIGLKFGLYLYIF